MERIGNALRLLLGVDMRHDDAQRAVVQQPRRLIERAGADAHDRRDASGQRGDADLRRLLHGEGAVLHVHEQVVVLRGAASIGAALLRR